MYLLTGRMDGCTDMNTMPQVSGMNVFHGVKQLALICNINAVEFLQNKLFGKKVTHRALGVLNVTQNWFWKGTNMVQSFKESLCGINHVLPDSQTATCVQTLSAYIQFLSGPPWECQKDLGTKTEEPPWGSSVQLRPPIISLASGPSRCRDVSRPITARLCVWERLQPLPDVCRKRSLSPSGTKDNQSIRSIFFPSSTFRWDSYCLQGFLHLGSSLHPKFIPSLRCVSLAFSPEAKQKWTSFVSILDSRPFSYSHLCNFLH